jgi:hypothetical protein
MTLPGRSDTGYRAHRPGRRRDNSGVVVTVTSDGRVVSRCCSTASSSARSPTRRNVDVAASNPTKRALRQDLVSDLEQALAAVRRATENLIEYEDLGDMGTVAKR